MMHKHRIIGIFFCASLLALWSFKLSPHEDWQNGDIVFQDSESTQSTAIKLATESDYSHCGIVMNLNDQWMVLEAVQPVQVTPIDEWIARGTGGKYKRKRLKNDAILSTEVATNMWKTGESFIGKNYDYLFGWGDDRLYCSELVWKIYQRGAGLKLGKLRPLKTYKLNDPIVREQLELRYGEKIPMDDNMISPQDIFESDLLE